MCESLRRVHCLQLLHNIGKHRLHVWFYVSPHYSCNPHPYSHNLCINHWYSRWKTDYFRPDPSAPWSSRSAASPAARSSATSGRPTSACCRRSTRRATRWMPSGSKGEWDTKYQFSRLKLDEGWWSKCLQILLPENVTGSCGPHWEIAKLRSAGKIVT